MARFFFLSRKDNNIVKIAIIAVIVAITTVAFAAQPCPNPSAGHPLSAFPEERLCSLGVLPSGSSSGAYAVSADGTVIVGYGSDDSGFAAVRWADGAIQTLGVLPGDRSSVALGVSGDHRVIVGRGDNAAVRWVDGVIQPLAALPGGRNSKAFGANADGSVVVGRSGDYAVQWVNGVIQKLEHVSGGRNSEAFGANADGSVVVGRSGDYAVQWTDGDPRNLGVLPGGTYSEAVAVSADGRVVVGDGDGPGKYEAHAIRWEDGVPRDLGTLPGGTNSYAYGVSDDGSVVVGDSQSANGVRAFVWKKTPPDPDPGSMQDLASLLTSFPQLAGDSDVTRGHFERRAALASDQTCLAESGGHCIRTTLTAEHTGADDDTGERFGLSGLFSFGRGLGRNNGTTLGATLDVSGGFMNGNAFDMNTGPAVALWAEHSEFGLSRVGWQASGAIGWTGASGKATRGRGLFGVTPVTGRAAMDTRIVRASLGYGFGTRPGYGWLLTPRVGIARYLTHRDGYAETDAEFDVTYDRETTRRTLLTLAVSAETGIGELGNVVLAGGVARDLSRDDTVLSGASDIPGMERFAMKSSLDRNDTRPFVSVSYSRSIGPGGTLSATVGISTPEFGDAPRLGMGVSYTVRF